MSVAPPKQCPERYAELRNEGQKSVLFHVFAAYQSLAQSPRASREDIVLSEHADTAPAACVKIQCARLYDRIRQNGQKGIIQHIQNKGKIKARRHFESVVIVLCGEPFELIGKYDDENERDEIIGARTPKRRYSRTRLCRPRPCAFARQIRPTAIPIKKLMNSDTEEMNSVQGSLVAIRLFAETPVSR